MSRYFLTPAAADDLEEIYGYLADRNLPAAGRLIDRLTDQFVRMAENPGIGRRRDELRPGLRSAAERNYVVFYRAVDAGVQIVRVLHGARDIETILRQTAGDE